MASADFFFVHHNPWFPKCYFFNDEIILIDFFFNIHYLGDMSLHITLNFFVWLGFDSEAPH